MTVRTRLIVLVALLLVPVASLADGATGTWKTTIGTQIGDQEYTYVFVVEGDSLTGKAISQWGETEITEGRVEGDTITFVENLDFDGMPLRIVYSGTDDGDEIHFTREVGEFAKEEFVAKRVG